MKTLTGPEDRGECFLQNHFDKYNPNKIFERIQGCMINRIAKAKEIQDHSIQRWKRLILKMESIFLQGRMQSGNFNFGVSELLSALFCNLYNVVLLDVNAFFKKSNEKNRNSITWHHIDAHMVISRIGIF